VKVLVFAEENQRKKKMKGVRIGASDGTVPEARDFERLNVSLRSASDVKSQPHDRATCLLITR